MQDNCLEPSLIFGSANFDLYRELDMKTWDKLLLNLKKKQAESSRKSSSK